MFWDDHNPPHFHASYGSEEALISIESASLLTGRLPPRVLGLVIEWTVLHKDELLEDWRRAGRREPLAPIPPLN